MTSDGGGSWWPSNSGVGYNLNDIYIIDENTAICVGDNGVVLVSFDGGETWIIYSIGNDDDLSDVTVRDCLGYITGESGGVYQFDVPNFNAEPPLVLLDLEVMCETDLNIAAVKEPIVGAEYVWNTGSTDTQIAITQSGDYWVAEYTLCDTLTSNIVSVTVVDAVTYWLDNDGDGWGDANNPIQTCDGPPAGYVDNDLDCWDDDDTQILCCPADLNNDGFRDTADLLLLLQVFGTDCGQPLCYGDFNGDGLSDTSDLLFMLTYFGTECP